MIVTIVALYYNPGVHSLQYVKPGHTCVLYIVQEGPQIAKILGRTYKNLHVRGHP